MLLYIHVKLLRIYHCVFLFAHQYSDEEKFKNVLYTLRFMEETILDALMGVKAMLVTSRKQSVTLLVLSFRVLTG